MGFHFLLEDRKISRSQVESCLPNACIFPVPLLRGVLVQFFTMNISLDATFQGEEVHINIRHCFLYFAFPVANRAAGLFLFIYFF